MSEGLQEVGRRTPKIKSELEEEDYLPSADIAGEEQDDHFVVDEDDIEYYEDEDFCIKQVAPPLIINRTLKDLHALSKGPYLDLNPDYQRDVVWQETRSSGLIASIFQGYFIPPLIFNLITVMEPPKDGGPNKVKKYYRTCVDGKQRMTSLILFMDGKIGVWDSCNPPKKWYFTHPISEGVQRDSNHLILPEKTKDFFRRRTFCCYEYSELPKSVEENMFQLVQRGMPLTPAEKMRALSTKWAVFAKQYEDDYSMVVNLSKQGRASGFRSVVTMFCQILEVMHPSGNKRTNREGVGQVPTLQSSPQVLSRLLLDDDSLSEAVKARFKEVFDKFQELVNLSSEPSDFTKSGYKTATDSAFDPAPNYLRERGVAHVKTFSPLELLATGILLLVHADSRTAGMLIGDIKEMRFYLRSAHKDLRLNPACWITVWKFIDEDLIRLRGGVGATRTNGVTTNVDREDNYRNVQNRERVMSSPDTSRQTKQGSKCRKHIDLPQEVSTDMSNNSEVARTKGKEDQSRSVKTSYGPIEDPGFARVLQPSKIQAPFFSGTSSDSADAIRSRASAISTGTSQNRAGLPNPRALQVATFSDESEDEKIASVSKKRKKL